MSSTLILGGARSGKSSYAENLASKYGNKVIYIATSEVLDSAIKQRIAKHKASRPAEWKTIEEPIKLASSLQQWATPDGVILVDCLTMWLTNLLMHKDKALLAQEIQQLLDCVKDLAGNVIFVSNEVSMGIIPMGELTRHYVDEAGLLHQKLAEIVDTVTLVVAGLPLKIKE